MQSSQQLFRQCVKDVLEPLMDLASVKFKKKVRFMWRGRQFSVFSQGNSKSPKATTFRLLVWLCFYDEDSEILGKIRVLLTMKSNIRLSILHTICLSFRAFDIGDLTLSDAAFRFFGYFTIIDNKCTKGILVISITQLVD